MRKGVTCSNIGQDDTFSYCCLQYTKAFVKKDFLQQMEIIHFIPTEALYHYKTNEYGGHSVVVLYCIFIDSTQVQNNA